ncbi:tetratricopeptide repeat protein [uncultured Desulfobulbus sp.]|uniref:tetratricopeptide repeat protein n=1 Tax=uncultured Desulfobulbus sp. TaxID=239745 RepID=UPI0029C99A5F|nr:tetratricopeptide repeat protein [uncultured Desulfobulbus sp.]
MTSRIILTALGLTLMVCNVSATADDRCIGVPESACRRFVEAVGMRQKNNPKGSLLVIEELSKNYSNNFTIQYTYGRLLAEDKRYEDAIKQLQIALELGHDFENFDIEIYNIIGFSLLMESRYDESIEYFYTIEMSEEFQKKSKDFKIKVYNNFGVAYMQLDRFQEAKEKFEKSKNLGSKLAYKNIEKIDSILESLRNGDVNMPGIFALIVANPTTEIYTQQSLLKVSNKLDIPSSGFTVFRATKGQYYIAMASQVSYPKAEQLKEQANKKGISDAFIGSITSWDNVTKNFYSKN